MRTSHWRCCLMAICRCMLERANRILLARCWLCPPPCLLCPLWLICSNWKRKVEVYLGLVIFFNRWRYCMRQGGFTSKGNGLFDCSLLNLPVQTQAKSHLMMIWRWNSWLAGHFTACNVTGARCPRGPPEWRYGLRHCISVESLKTLVRFQAVSQRTICQV